ncbi:zinc finger protein 691-like [Ruditapes philippinarum]|uniref:zinc finger protein 691-like n=1 Tax=Ruditapes philippinarum TaxID=129788 RepID=UPI00295A6E26|nr:zinc finger protein 691-like [Ruditapes philippinarum]
MTHTDDVRHRSLSRAERQSLRWNQTSSRRQQIPRYSNSLAVADTRQRKCETCGQWFSNVHDMRRHISLTHTGRKPVVCEICGKRFGNTQQMMAHYKTHREPRLEEFSILKKRRQPDVVSEPSESSQTTIGTYHRVPKTLKSYISGFSDDRVSFGTGQSYKVSRETDSATKDISGKYLKSAKSNKLPKIEQVAKTDVIHKATSDRDSVTLPKINKKSGIPTPDPSHISTVDNVMGLTKLIETSQESLKFWV